jgi:hypothetical protein
MADGDTYASKFLVLIYLTHETSSSDSEYPGDVISLDSPLTSMQLRQTSLVNTGCPFDRYGFTHNITQFISYSSISLAHTTFITSLAVFLYSGVGK